MPTFFQVYPSNQAEAYSLLPKSAAVPTLAKARLMTNESDDRSPLVSRSNPGAAAFAFAKLRKRDFRRLHPRVRE